MRGNESESNCFQNWQLQEIDDMNEGILILL